MHSLNRYAKYESCTRRHQDEIYDLKNRLIRLLYAQGFAVEVKLHHADYPAKQCHGCDGTGFRYGGEACHRCGGTGVYQGPVRRNFYAFMFEVDSGTYRWHQPANLVNFDVQVTCEPEPTDPDALAVEKPLAMKRTHFAAAKALIAWAMDDYQRSQGTQAGSVVSGEGEHSISGGRFVGRSSKLLE